MNNGSNKETSTLKPDFLDVFPACNIKYKQMFYKVVVNEMENVIEKHNLIETETSRCILEGGYRRTTFLSQQLDTDHILN